MPNRTALSWTGLESLWKIELESVAIGTYTQYIPMWLLNTSRALRLSTFFYISATKKYLVVKHLSISCKSMDYKTSPLCLFGFTSNKTTFPLQNCSWRFVIERFHGEWNMTRVSIFSEILVPGKSGNGKCHSECRERILR